MSSDWRSQSFEKKKKKIGSPNLDPIALNQAQN